jgi:hypothetical protein
MFGKRKDKMKSKQSIKVISLWEPFASLIKEGVKLIETRSWGTSYRGELYIHVCQKRVVGKVAIEYQEQLKLLKNTNFDYGCIILKCKLIDCKYMTAEFIEKVKKNPNEYISGFYSVGRYAWILEDVEVLDTPIPAKGWFGIWEYKPTTLTQKVA